MPQTSLAEFSNQIADAVEIAAQSVVQVHGRRQPASGVVYAPDIVVTTTRAIGREDGLTVSTPDGRTLDAELAGWDPATHLVALRAAGLNVAAATIAGAAPRVGHLAVAVGRSWSNAVTASTGIVSIIGGPLRTGRGRQIDEIIRTNAPMHRGFAGGAFVDTDGRLLGISTAAEIRGLGVVIPAGIAWKAAAELIEHGRARRGYLGVAGQGVKLGASQRGAGTAEAAVLVVQVVDGSPADRAGLVVGDLLVSIDGSALASPDQLLEALARRGGQTATLGVVRGQALVDVQVALSER
ncbi:MAG TPA: trypsin-like peptidase domain-containing protein [Vicinamibacterales bacterium]|nr:trypsin-like peptidase domain-containing protein [Vicinamibacterales bacterium]